MRFISTPGLRVAASQLYLVGAGLAGGWLFSLIQMPAAWLAGSMAATVVLCALRLAPPMLPTIREIAMLLAGLAMGVAVTPETLHALGAYPVSLALLAVCMVVIMAASSFALARFRGWSPRDAFFASAPGALSAVLVIAVQERADIPRIAIVQIIRLLILIFVLPPIISALEPAAVLAAAPASILEPWAFALLAVAALLGWALFERWRISASVMLGAMFGSAIFTGTGLIDGRLPAPIATLGFVMVGCFIGQRFRGVEWGLLIRCLPDALLSVVVGLGVAAMFSALVSALTGVPFDNAVVALSPGGLEAMTMLALALKLDMVYVGVHHTVRFLFVGVWVAIALRLFPRWLHTRGRLRTDDDGPPTS